jgi:hypothetical protein
MKKYLLFFLLAVISSSNLWASENDITDTNQLKAQRIKVAPKIDGLLSETVWQNGDVFFEGFFTENSPNNGKKSPYKTKVQIVYTDFAIYIAARMYDSSPDSIPTQLGLRDSWDRNADVFSISFDTYKTRQNALAFIVSSAGVQTDINISSNNDDVNWDAVWKSAVNIDKEGWTVELEIPYSALRFPKQEVQDWGINFGRIVKRHQSETFWHHIDASIDGFANQFGTLTGIEGIEPPLRLSLSPYVSTYAISDADGKSSFSVNGGLDLKYGINEAFTLDMTLVPDFGQVQSDNLVLNLSAFEVQFSENRPFFTEGVDLFNKGNLFYSRRVGQSFESVYELRDADTVISSSSTVPLINATKISGRTKKGLGIGIFNAVTNENFSLVQDTTNTALGPHLVEDPRNVLSDPVTNFNVLVLEQSLKNNSNISLINTNVTRAKGGYNANVTATDFAFNNKKNSWGFDGFAAVSQIMTKDSETGEVDNQVGYRYRWNAGKKSGAFQFNFNQSVESDKYDINDMGFLRRNNNVSNNLRLEYNKFKPFWKGRILNASARLGLWYNQLYKPRKYANAGYWTNINMQFKNFWNLGLNHSARPTVTNDFFAPREDNYHFARPKNTDFNMWMSSDSRKKIQFSMYSGFWMRKEWNQFDNWFGINPTIRFSDKFSLNHDLNVTLIRKERGYADKTYTEDDELKEVIFGTRDRKQIVNTSTLTYSFNELMGINLRVRHYWARVEYAQFHGLVEDGHENAGELIDTDYTGIDDKGVRFNNTNYNAFSVDLLYRWRFAPGSEVNIAWKNNILTEDNNPHVKFGENLGNMINSAQLNSFSIRVLYFLDYLSVKRAFSKKSV